MLQFCAGTRSGTPSKLRLRGRGIGLAAIGVLAFGANSAAAQDSACAKSPDSRIQVCVSVAGGRAQYTVERDGKTVVAPSNLGMSFEGEAIPRFEAMSDIARKEERTSWEQPWGEARVVANDYSQLAVVLRGDTPLTRETGLTIRVFDDGLGLRYEFADIPAGREVSVVGDLTEFRLGSGKWEAWWYPALQPDRDEYLYSRTDARRITLAETPLTMRREDGLHASIHEAALIDFPSMLLSGDGSGSLRSWLTPLPDGISARISGPFETPWRTILLGDSAGALADSRLTLNLNEPNRLGDVSWGEPGKYVGIWWEMHLDKSTWASGPRHGATSANAKRYIDFAHANGFDGVLVEGWNEGWDGDWIQNGNKFSFTQPYPDFDIGEVTRYGLGKGVRLIGHNETGGGITNYERQLDDALDFYARLGVRQIKTGYVRRSGDVDDFEGPGHWFADQFMVRHHQRVAEAAAKRQIAINAHEPVKDTGLRRTWPNLISREGARGQEFNAWGRPTNPPEHRSILPFTRLLAGPMDFTPGIFDIERGGVPLDHRVQSTLAAQLALYVVFYSPIQMAADLPENYARRPDAFQFIRDVPTDWERSRTLQGEIGDFAVVARQERGSADWFLGGVTDENARSLIQPLDFLEAGRQYEAQIYRDGDDADYRTMPLALEISNMTVTKDTVLGLRLAPGGGVAIRFRAL